jgi:FemAB-related protein (PEP-CTERM system-associated)
MADVEQDMSGQVAVSAAFEVRVSSRQPDWGNYLRRRGDATIYHDPRWGQVMRRAYGNKPFYLTATSGCDVKGVLALVWQKSLLFGSRLCSLPYFDSAGILADDQRAVAALLAEAERLAGGIGAGCVELRHATPVAASLPSRTDKVRLELPLTAGAEGIWNGLKAKVRNQVRKARRANLTVHRGGGELLREFHGIYCRNMRDLGSPPHSLRFLRLLPEAFGRAAALFAVRAGRCTVAAALTLTDHHAVHVPWAGSDWRARQLCPNMLLYWSMIEDACARRANCFDFGRSTRGSGTYRFKTQWGGEERPLYWQFLLPEGGEVPEVRPDSAKYRLLVATWKRLPVPLVRLLGPRIIARLA